MLSATFILSLLASVATAQLSESKPLPSFALVSSGATIEPPPTTVSSPAVSRIPASESFNPSKAPAFTPRAGAPDLSALPVYPSTPCASKIAPKSTYSVTANLSIGQPVPTPGVAESSAFKIPSSDHGPRTSPTVSPTPPPNNDTEGNEQRKTPCSEEEGKKIPKPLTTITPVPTPADTLASFQTTGLPLFPTVSINAGRPALPDLPSGHPGYGWGRPRPSGMWPSRRPSAGFWHSRLSGDFAKPSSGADKPCTTFETRVRPMPTGF